MSRRRCLPALTVLAWPAGRAAELLELLAAHAGSERAAPAPPPPPPLPPPGNLSSPSAAPFADWLAAAAAAAGFVAQETELSARRLERPLRGPFPLLVGLPGSPAPALLAILGAGRSGVRVLASDRSRVRVPRRNVARALSAALAAPIDAQIASLAAAAAIPLDMQRRFSTALRRELLATAAIRPCWTLRPAPATPLRGQLARAGLPAALVQIALARATQGLFALAAWWLLAESVLEQRLQPALAGAWTLAVLSAIPCRMVELSSSIAAAGRFGTVLRRWLASAVLRADDLSGKLAARASGSLFARVLDLDLLAVTALSGCDKALAALLEIALSVCLLRAGDAGAALLALLAGFLTLTAVLGVRCGAVRQASATARTALSASLTENFCGHLTRLVQLPEHLWHAEDEPQLLAYLDLSRRADRRGTWLAAAISRAWLLAGLFLLSAAALAGAPTVRAPQMGAALAGVLLAGAALSKSTGALFDLVGAAIAWRALASLLGPTADLSRRCAAPDLAAQSAGAALADSPRDVTFSALKATICTGPHHTPARRRLHLPAPGPLSPALPSVSPPPAPRGEFYAEPLIAARAVGLRHRARLALAPVDLALQEGDRLLITGPSGSGKSTLGALLAGLASPTSGTLFLRGLDHHVLGAEGWQSLAVRAPQHDENHLFSQSLAFNLLLGCRWPAAPADLRRAERLCRDLGLGDLLGRLPQGLEQPVGDSGWQLSQGERSRVFLARALLQQRELTILDESFDSLDPETAATVLACVLARTRTLAVIAHP
ncbi:MAG TPA: ATP-binding cassette domain-containing protein [Thermoanaerobaculia bacterium]|nr:ATP-binding cassette domain-containing protein [Thermoanaerobaculia bacterium]